MWGEVRLIGLHRPQAADARVGCDTHDWILAEHRTFQIGDLHRCPLCIKVALKSFDRHADDADSRGFSQIFVLTCGNLRPIRPNLRSIFNFDVSLALYTGWDDHRSA